MPQGEDFELGGHERYFPVKGRPRRLEPGDTVFFSHRGKIVGRSKLLDLRPVPSKDKMEYLEQGSPTHPDLYHYLVVGPIRQIRGGPVFTGRVGIRYVDRLTAPLKRKLMEMAL